MMSADNLGYSIKVGSMLRFASGQSLAWLIYEVPYAVEPSDDDAIAVDILRGSLLGSRSLVRIGELKNLGFHLAGSLSKNADKLHKVEMHQITNGNQWHC